MKELNLEQMETTQGGKFFGVDKQCSVFMDTPVCTCHFDAFWIQVNDSWAC